MKLFKENLWSKYQNTSLISNLTTRNGNEKFYYSKESRALFCGQELGPLSDNWVKEQSLHFCYYSKENSVEQSIAKFV